MCPRALQFSPSFGSNLGHPRRNRVESRASGPRGHRHHDLHRLRRLLQAWDASDKTSDKRKTSDSLGIMSGSTVPLLLRRTSSDSRMLPQGQSLARGEVISSGAKPQALGQTVFARVQQDVPSDCPRVEEGMISADGARRPRSAGKVMPTAREEVLVRRPVWSPDVLRVLPHGGSSAGRGARQGAVHWSEVPHSDPVPSERAGS